MYKILFTNRSLLQDLTDCGRDAVSLARCFVKKEEGFHVYTYYCTNYPR